MTECNCRELPHHPLCYRATDPIGTAQERELIAAALAKSDDMPWDECSEDSRRVYRRYADAALQSRIAEVGRLTERVRILEGLISEPSIERLAEDIAVACVDCLPHIRVPRHSAMVRLGERLRNPLPNDIDAALSLQRRV